MSEKNILCTNGLSMLQVMAVLVVHVKDEHCTAESHILSRLVRTPHHKPHNVEVRSVDFRHVFHSLVVSVMCVTCLLRRTWKYSGIRQLAGESPGTCQEKSSWGNCS